MTELFAVIPVSDFAAARPWYEQLLGGPPSFCPHDTEAIWEVGEHRYLGILEDPERAGGGLPTLIVDDLDAVVGAIAGRGLEPAKRETYDNGVRKITFRDADGNLIGYGGLPPEA